jgi:fluoride ion exporter CrcB/FEX
VYSSIAGANQRLAPLVKTGLPVSVFAGSLGGYTTFSAMTPDMYALLNVIPSDYSSERMFESDVT